MRLLNCLGCVLICFIYQRWIHSTEYWGWRTPLNPSARTETLTAHSQAVFGDCQGGDSIVSLGSLCHCSATSAAYKCFLVFTRSLLCSNFCPLPVVLALVTLLRAWSCPLHPPLRYLQTLVTSLQGLLQPEQSWLYHPVLTGNVLQPLVAFGSQGVSWSPVILPCCYRANRRY